MKTFVLKTEDDWYVAPNPWLSGMLLTQDKSEAMEFELEYDDPELKIETYELLGKIYFPDSNIILTMEMK